MASAGINITESYQDERLKQMHLVIKKLRLEKLSAGRCFMILDKTLPDGQAYYEYPDGSIMIEELNRSNMDLPRIIVRQLDETEIVLVKAKHEVFH